MNRQLLALALAAALGILGYYIGIQVKKEEPQKKEWPKTTGRWIMFKKNDLVKKPGVKVMSIPGAQNLEGLNAYVFDSKPEATLRSFDNGEWEVQEELVHHIFLGAAPVETKCYQSAGPLVEIACEGGGTQPAPQPTPSPAPAPSPQPGPIDQDRSWGRARVHAKEAQALIDTSKVKVCIVDTGIDLQHPNKGNVIGTKDFTGKGTAQDGAGHGTHTSGTVGGIGGVGVSHAQLLICKGLGDDGSGSSASLAQCLNWCGQQGAQIVSNSWGSPQSDPMINQTIQSLTQRGIYVFVAAGNDSGPVNWPAKLAGSNPLVYAIAASDQRDQITSFSSRGPEIRFISPGAGILSNWPGGGTRPLDGTSMATPHAAAICAFGVAKGIKPCVKASGAVAGYPFADALETAK